MRYTLTFLSLLINLSCGTDNKKIDRSEDQSFPNIYIDFITGDEVITYHSMSILKDGQTITAKKIKPNYYYGGKTDSIWINELDKFQLGFLEKFIEIARIQNDTCSLLSTSIDHYRIKIGENEKINIIGNCDWKGIDYDSLESILFKNKFIELEIKRASVTDSILYAFEGTWDVYGWQNGSLVDRNVILTRKQTQNHIVEGSTKWSFDSIKLDGMRESMNIIGRSTSIQIRGSRYEILDIQKNKISLKYLW